MTVSRTSVEWRLEVEWDRQTYTGSYERHITERDARGALAVYMTEDPPARWRIFRESVTKDCCEEAGTWSEGLR